MELESTQKIIEERSVERRRSRRRWTK